MTDQLSLVQSLQTIYSLRTVPRKGWLLRGVPPELCESVAAHSYRTARAGFHYTRDIGLVSMLVVHDWAEAIVGDITPHDNIPKDEKHRREINAMRRIATPLPFGEKIMALWLEYDAGRTPRAQTAKQLDKLDAGVMALTYEQMGYPKVSDFFDYTLGKLETPSLRTVFETLLRKEHDLLSSHEVYFGLLEKARVGNL